MRAGATTALCAALASAALAAPAVDVRVAPEPALLAHGPWPAATGRDPSNRASGRPDAIEFGYHMFREPRFSPNGYVACISCHQTDRAFTDAIARAQGLAPLPRNTPTLANLRLQRWYGWDGASDSLWMASLRPMLDAREIGADAARVARVVRIGNGHACRYRRAFGAAPEAHGDLTVMVNVAKATAAFVETLVTGRTAFDTYRDALAQGDAAGIARYPEPARRGATLFVGRAACATCHAGPNFSDGRFHAAPAGLTNGIDAGREDGLARWRASVFNRFGRFSDAPAHPTRADLLAHADAAARGHFRTPSLRNVAVTPPYMHDGRFDSLDQAVRHGPGDAGQLSDADVADLVAFLSTLTDVQGAARQFPPRPRSPC